MLPLQFDEDAGRLADVLGTLMLTALRLKREITINISN